MDREQPSGRAEKPFQTSSYKAVVRINGKEKIMAFYRRRKARLLARGLRYDSKNDTMRWPDRREWDSKAGGQSWHTVGFGDGSVRADDWDESRHPRSKDGRFTSGGGSSGGSKSNAPKESKLPSAESIGFKPKTKSTYRNKRDEIVERHKALRKSEGLDGMPDCTCDPDTGEMVSFDDGYQVSFQTSLSESGEPGSMSDKEYDDAVEELRKKTGSKAYVGVFDEAETSFHCKSREEAMEIAKRYNQKSIMDWAAFKKYKDIDMSKWTKKMYEEVFPPNPYYDPSKNHVKGM